MRLRSYSLLAIGALVAAGCNNNPPPVSPAPSVSGPSAVVAPPAVTPGMAPPVVSPPSAAAPTPATVTNLHPDLVTFGFEWSPKGPYHEDWAAAGRPKLEPADNDALITKVLADLDSAQGNAAAQEQALVDLKRANRHEPRRAEVSQALEPLLNSPAQRVQIRAVQACATWGTSANLPSLQKLAALDDPHFSNDAVFAIYCTAGMSQVVPYLSLTHSYHGAHRVFVQERKGEELLWPLLSSPDPHTIYRALGALYHAGTPQSVSHLIGLKQHPDLRVSRTSQAVIHEIQKRQK